MCSTQVHQVPTDSVSWLRCHTSSIVTPVGLILVMQVCGDVDLATEHHLSSALHAARARHPTHLVLDLTALGFCSGRGLRHLVDPADVGVPVQHLFSGADPRLIRLLDTFWPDVVATRYPTLHSAVLAAVAGQQPATGGRRSPDARLRRNLGTGRPKVADGGGSDDVQHLADQLGTALSALRAEDPL